MKNKKLLILFIICLIAGKNSFSESFESRIYKSLYDTTIGTKTSDTSGIVTISNSQIQQLIVYKIPFIYRNQITSDEPIVSIGSTSSYLIFRTSTPSLDTISIAIPVNISGNTILFQPNINKTVHVCKGNINCSRCTFSFDKSKNIKGCYVKGEERKINCCSHYLTKLQ